MYSGRVDRYESPYGWCVSGSDEQAITAPIHSATPAAVHRSITVSDVALTTGQTHCRVCARCLALYANAD